MDYDDAYDKKPRVASKQSGALPVTAGDFPQLARVTFNANPPVDAVAVTISGRNKGILYYSNAGPGAHVFDICCKDILLQHSGERVSSFKRMGPQTSRATVFGSLNAYEAPRDIFQRWEVIESLRYAGIAQIDCKYIGDKFETNDLSVSPGGSNSIRNNGTDHIMSGDLLYWDLPLMDEKGKAFGYNLQAGMPAGKIPIVVRPYRPMEQGGVSKGILRAVAEDRTALTDRERVNELPIARLFDVIVRIAVAHSSDTAEGALTAASREETRGRVLDLLLNGLGGNKNFSNLFSELMSTAGVVLNHVKGRVFATALSNSQPGEKIDIFEGVYRG